MGVSFGEGIGLEQNLSQPLRIEENALNRQDKQDAYAQKLKAKKDADDDKNLGKITDKDFKVDTKLYHPKFLPFVLQSNREAIQKIQDLKKSGDPNWMNRVQPIVDDAVKEMDLQQRNSKVAFAHEGAHADKVYKSGDLSTSLNQNFGDLTDIQSDPSSGVQWNPQSRSLSYNPNPVLDTKKLRQSEVYKDPSLYTQDMPVQKGWTPTGQPIMETVKGIPDEALQVHSASLMNNDNYAFSVAREYNKETGHKMPDKGINDPEYFNKISDWHLKKMRDESNPQSSYKFGAKPSRVSQSDKNKPINKFGNFDVDSGKRDGILVDDNIVFRSQSKEGNDLPEVVVPFKNTFSFSEPSKATNVNLSNGVVLAKSGEKFKSGQGDVKIGQIGNIFDPRTSKYVPVAIGKVTSQFKGIIETSNGSKGYNLTNNDQVIIPLDKVRSYLKENGIPTDFAYEGANKLNGGENVPSSTHKNEGISMNQQSAIDAFKEQFKREPTQSEHEKILTKYK